MFPAMKYTAGDVLELEITDLAFGGEGVARQEGMVFFVNGGITGQTVKAKIKRVKRRFGEAVALEVIKRSELEIEPEFQLVPGAPWETLPVEKQREIKKAQVFELFQKFAKLDLTSVFDELIPSPRDWFYRNKMDFSFGTDTEGKFALGSKKRGQFRLVESLEKPCGLFDEAFEKLLPTIREWCEKTGLPPHDGQGGGYFESLIVRRSVAEDKFLVEIVVAGPDKKFDSAAFGALMQELLGTRFGGAFWTQKIRKEGAQTQLLSTFITGEEKLREELCGLEFEISRDAFFQPNPYSAEKLYEKVVEFVDLQKGESALDLFCGTGTIAQILAKKYPDSRVIGVEIVESAVEDAKKNAERNNLKNVTFACADVRKWLKEHFHSAVKETSQEVIVVDPPRSGIVKKSLERIIDRAPGRIVYVSCNPATLARDTEILMEAGYKIDKFALVDQFPHTAHVEAVARFVKKY
jgi:23S rRNA (uracil-5-)-methyltransferase RumA